jgi:hypothetical protein
MPRPTRPSDQLFYLQLSLKTLDGRRSTLWPPKSAMGSRAGSKESLSASGGGSSRENLRSNLRSNMRSGGGSRDNIRGNRANGNGAQGNSGNRSAGMTRDGRRSAGTTANTNSLRATDSDDLNTLQQEEQLQEQDPVMLDPSPYCVVFQVGSRDILYDLTKFCLDIKDIYEELELRAKLGPAGDANNANSEARAVPFRTANWISTAQCLQDFRYKSFTLTSVPLKSVTTLEELVRKNVVFSLGR